MATGNWRYKILDISSYVTVYPGFFRALEEAGYSGVCLRLGVGSTKDSKVDLFFAQARAETSDSFAVGFYYVPNPVYSIAVNLGYVTQFIGSKQFDFGSGDYERTFGVSYSFYLFFMVEFQIALEAQVPGLPMVAYTAKWFMDYLGNDPRLKNFLWWIAVYYNQISVFPPANQLPWAVPRQIGLEDVGVWQFYNKWREPHSPSYIDANVGWLEIADWFNPPAPPPAITHRAITASGVRLRDKPYGEILGVADLGSIWLAGDSALYPDLVDTDGRVWAPLVCYVASWLTAPTNQGNI